MKTKIYSVFCMLLLASLLSACNPLQTLKSRNKWTDFDSAFQNYSKHLRWGHFREAAGFMTRQRQIESQALLAKLKNRRVSGVKATNWIMNKEEDEISGTIEISYYLEDRGVIRQTEQTQTWILQEKNWILDSPLPDLP